MALSYLHSFGLRGAPSMVAGVFWFRLLLSCFSASSRTSSGPMSCALGGEARSPKPGDMLVVILRDGVKYVAHEVVPRDELSQDEPHRSPVVYQALRQLRHVDARERRERR